MSRQVNRSAPRRTLGVTAVTLALLALPVAGASAAPVIGWGPAGPLGLSSIATTPNLQPIPLIDVGSADDITAAAVTPGASYLLRPAGVLSTGPGTTGPFDLGQHFKLIPGTDGATAIAAGGDAVLAVRQGHVLAFGDNAYGATGQPVGTATPSPAEVSGLDDVVSVAAGQLNSLALESDGTVWAWGAAASLGSAAGVAGTDTNVPARVTLPDPAADPAKKVKQIAFGYGHGLALLDDGSVYAWGSNAFGQVGDGTTTDAAVPVEVIGPEPDGSPKVTQITAGTYASYALSSDGTFKAWGNNSYGELGLGLGTDPSVPVTAPASPSATAVAEQPDRYPSFSKISAIGYAVFATTASGAAYGERLLGWGSGENLGFSGAARYDFAFPYANAAGDPGQGATEIPQQINRLQAVAWLGTGSTGGSPIVSAYGQLRPSISMQVPFFTQPVGTTSPVQVAPAQTLFAPATVTRIRISGPNAGDFLLTGFTDGNGNGNDSGTLPITFQPAGSLFLSVRFLPTAVGDRYATLQLDADGQTTYFELTGAGVPLPGNTPGEKGEKGDTGAGAPGRDGTNGTNGTNGGNGANGKDGKDGVVTFVTTAKTTTVKRGHRASLRFTLKNATAAPIVKTTAILSVPPALKATGKRLVTVGAIKAGARRPIAFALKVGKDAKPGLRTVKVRIPFGAKSITTTAQVRVVR
jgi:hypothetical protein